jgi:aminopeptidase N
MPWVAGEIRNRFEKEASYIAYGNALRALGSLDSVKSPEILKRALTLDSWNDIIRIASLEGLAATKSAVFIPLFLSCLRPDRHQRLRMAAVRCLAQVGRGHEGVQNRLVALMQDPFLLVAIAAVRAIHEIGDERVLPHLKKLTTGDRDGRLKRLAEEAIDKISKGFEG